MSKKTTMGWLIGSVIAVMLTGVDEEPATACEGALEVADELLDDLAVAQEYATDGTPEGNLIAADIVAVIPEEEFLKYEILRDSCLSGSMASDG